MTVEQQLREARKTVSALPVPANSLKIISRSSMEVSGKRVKITKEAFKDILSFAGLANRTVEHINRSLVDGGGFALVKQLMKAIGSKRGEKVVLYIDESNLTVERVVPESQAAAGESGHSISATALGDLVGDVIEKNNGLVRLTNTSVSHGGTKAQFNLVVDNPTSIGMKGEDISFGKTFTWDAFNVTKVEDFINRLVCENGMTALIGTKTSYMSAGTDPAEWYQELYRDLFVPQQEKIERYAERVAVAKKTALSALEYGRIKHLLQTTFPEDDARITRYLGNEDWKLQYAKAGTVLESLTVPQLRNCPTSVNAWQAINCMTDMASHTYASRTTPARKHAVQKEAGRLLGSEWDSHSWVLNTPKIPVLEYEEVAVAAR